MRIDNATAGIDGYGEIHGGMVKLLEDARRAVARSVNAQITASYWEIGRRIVDYEQAGSSRAAYGEVLIERLAKDLTRRFGRGFSRQNLWQMRAFYIAWPAKRAAGRLASQEILQTMSGESSSPRALTAHFPLPWSAYVRLLSVKSTAARDFYETGVRVALPAYSRSVNTYATGCQEPPPRRIL